MTYAQTGEDDIVAAYFGDRIARLLDVGAYDGYKNSNSRLFIERGWGATLVEGGSLAFGRLMERYAHEDRVTLVRAVIVPWATRHTQPGIGLWHEAVEYNSYPGQYSTAVPAQYEHMQDRPYDLAWNRIYAALTTIAEVILVAPGPYPYVSIDIEGSSVEVLCEIPLGELGTEVVCVEHNHGSAEAHPSTVEGAFDCVVAYCAEHGLTQILDCNDANIIVARPKDTP